MSLLLNPLRRSSSPELSDSDDLTSFSSSLYCDEDPLEETGEGEVLDPLLDRISSSTPDADDGELCSLLLKEQSSEWKPKSAVGNSTRRRQAAEWMIKVNTHYGFSTLTAVLAIDYLDRFLSAAGTPCYRDKPWTIQLVAVACLSLAAKVEETDVPLLLDLQVEDAKYVFEAKTIQRMELLILSELGWKMHPVTPISFMDSIVEKLRLKNGDAHWELLSRCHRLLLCLLSDARSVRYRPSVVATATVMHVLDQVEHFDSVDSQTRLLSLLNISQEKVKDCYDLVMEIAAGRNNKRKYSSSSHEEEEEEVCPSSPSEVIDATNNSTDDSISSSSSNQSLKKKSRIQEEEEEEEEDQWVLVGFLGSPN
ncbi:CYCD3-1 [Linum grandiflorum]